MSFLTHLDWRHATKAFDPNKSVSESDLSKILQATRMAPSSFGLQPYHVEIIIDKVIREKMLPLAWNQLQVTTSSALLVFVAHTDMPKRIDQLFHGISGGDAQVRDKMKDYEGMMNGFVANKNHEELKAWTSKQCYIALGFAIAACAELEIDSCPMEGFAGPEFDRLLGLPEGQYSTVLLPIGHRDAKLEIKPKFRFPHTDIFKHR